MRQSILIIIIFLIFISCSSQVSKPYLDKLRISKIELLVGDSAIMDEWYNHQDSGLLVTNWAIFFVDSLGKTSHTPMQKIVFSNAGKDSLINIINSFKEEDDNFDRPCIPVFRHSLLCYTNDNKLIGKADICFDCSTMFFSDPPKEVDMYYDLNKSTNKTLIAFFKSRNVYLYNIREELLLP